MNLSEDSKFTVRPLTIDDVEQYNALLRYAFQVTEQELAETGWKDDEIQQSKFPVLERADVLGCFDDDELVSQFAVYPLDMNIYGRKYSVGFVTSVCTYPEYTGHGIMKNLMRRGLTRMKENGKSFALLYPYSIPLYRNLGWEIMHIKEMIYLNREAQLGLWEYVYAHDSMIDEVHGNNYYSEPIAFELDDSDIKETIRPYAMGRIIDFGQFISDYACNPKGKNVTIRFDIEDDLLEWNNSEYTVRFKKGACSLTDEEPDYVLQMSIGTLTTLFMGYKTADKLYNMKRIIGDIKAVEALDNILYHEIPYVSDYI